MKGLALLVLGLALRAQDPSWRLLYEQDGFRAYESRGKPLVYRAEGVVDVGLMEIAAVLVDVPGRTEWVTRLAESRLLEGDPFGRQTVYNRYALPWPARDRDVVVSSEVEVDEVAGRVFVRFRQAQSPLAPPRDGCIRVPLSEGEFTLKDTGRGSVAVTYTVRLDPGGWLPDWIVRIFVRDAPADTLKRFRARVAATRGQHQGFITAYRARRKAPPAP